MKLWAKTLLGLIIGFILGICIKSTVLEMGIEPVVNEWFRALGQAFMRLVMMALPLLLLSSMTLGITSIQDAKRLSQLGMKTLLLFLLNTVIAILLAFMIGLIISPGKGVDFSSFQGATFLPSFSSANFSFSQFFQELFPDNPINSLANNNLLQILVFSVFLGLAINASGEKGGALKNLLESISEVMNKLVFIVMQFSPYGIGAIMAWIGLSFGWQVLQALFEFLVAIYITSGLFLIIVYGGLMWHLRLSPMKLLKGCKEALIFAFTSCSSSATLPISLVCVQKNLGVPMPVASFVLPLGTTINMSGTAIFQAIASIFVAQVYGIEITIVQYVIITVMVILGAVGTAGVPGSSFVILGTVLTAAGLPKEGLAIIWGIDRLRDMIGTVLNVLGDIIISVFIAKKEGILDESVFNNTLPNDFDKMN